MSDAKHTPGPQRAAMLALHAHGFSVHDAWLGSYYDGIHAVKRVGKHRVEIYVGNADNGEYGDLHYAPVVYVNDKRVASDMPTVEKARRIADMRVCMFRAAIAKATGSTS